MLDDKLKFNVHIKLMCKKNSKSIGIIYVLSKYLSLPSLISIYYTLVYPYFIYCSLAWGQTYATHLKPLVILQKKVLRIINKVPYNSHTNHLFFSNSIMKLEDLLKYRQAVYMYCNINNQYVRSHHYSTRHRSNLLPPFQRLSSTQQSLSFSAPSIWNQIPNELKSAPSLPIFKRSLKNFYCSNYNTDAM